MANHLIIIYSYRPEPKEIPFVEAIASPNPLTRRQIEILNQVAQGNGNKQIAYILCISENTVRNHLKVIFRRISANDRAHAVALAIRNGWLSLKEVMPMVERGVGRGINQLKGEE
jgi:DNA-binding NarL/FixJ family response regulator